MILIYIIPALLLLTLWRITLINGITREWNSYLDDYIFDMTHASDCSPKYIEWLAKHKVKAKHLYLRLNVWEIEQVINDPFLLQDVLSKMER